MSSAVLKAYLDLCRVSNLPTVWTNVLAATLLSGGAFNSFAIFPLALSISCFYLAGMALNDLCDWEHDLVQRPSRPLPSGRIRRHEARVFTVSLFAAGFLLLLPAPHPRAGWAAMILCAAIVLYDLHHKENPYSVFLMACCRFLVFVVAAFAVSGHLTEAVLLAGSLQFGYIVLVSLVARYDNNRSDPVPFPLIPVLLAGISLLDGLVLAFLLHPWWLVAGIAGFLLTLAGQRYVRGD